MFTMSPLFFSKGVSATYLNQLSTMPKAAYSLKRIISTATKSVRVRRSSDSAEQDIGFSGDALDTTSLASFVGGGSGFVTRVYDQTGNGLDIVQGTSNKQPRVVNAGTYDGALIFDGTDDAMSVAAFPLSLPQAAIYGKIKQNTSGTKILLEASLNFNNSSGTIAFYVESSTYAMGMNNVAPANQKINYFGLALDTALTQFSLLYDRSLTGNNETKAWSGGTSRSATNTIYTTEQTGSFATNDLYIGSRAGTSLYSDMSVFSLVIYDGDTAALRQSIEAIVA